MTIAVGTRLGPYEILAPIGAGGMGEVYKARDTRLDRTVAVKVLPVHLTSPEVRQRFEREARTISQLSHPHICALFDVGREGETDYLVMEYLEGEPLSSRLDKGPLPLEQTLRYGIEIADALDKAHRQGVIHRDLKPANVMLTKTGVKLLDFGLAKVMTPANRTSELSALQTITGKPGNLTQDGMILGTLPYMAPEQVEGKEADTRTDIFALGATLYEMATGKRAFTGATSASLISVILRDEPKPVSQVLSMSPPALDRIIATCFAKDPEKRWQSAADVALQLGWVSRGGVDQPSTPARGLSLAPRWLMGLTAAGILASAALAVLLVRRPAPSAAAATPVRFFIRAPEGTSFTWIRPQNLFAVSPDGKRIAFVAQSATGQDSLWVRPFAQPSAVQLAGTEGASAPFWSPDSRLVGFFADGKLKKIDASTGPPVTVCDAAMPTPSGSWGSQHTILFAAQTGPSVSLVEEGGGAPRVVVKVDSAREETSIGWPSFLPDGRHFLYVGRSKAEAHTYIRLASVEDGKSVPLVTDCSRAQYVPGDPDIRGGSGHLLFARDGSLLAQPFDAARLELIGNPIPAGQEIWQHVFIGSGAFSASDNGVLASRGRAGLTRLAWIDRTGREAGSLAKPAEFDSVRLSPDSRSVVLTRGDPRHGRHDLWIGELPREVLTSLSLGEEDYMAPTWSPDGARIAFSIGSSNHPPNLTWVSLHGSASREAIIPAGPIQRATDWSPDGRFLLYTIRSGAEPGLWVVNLEGERKSRRLVSVPADAIPQVRAQFSPDGRWIAYGFPESDRSEIFLTSFPEPGERIRVSASGGSSPRWRRDGRELYFVSGDNEMLATPIQLGSKVLVGKSQPLFRMGSSGWQDYDVTGGGERFLVVENLPAADANAIAVTTDWPSLLRR